MTLYLWDIVICLEDLRDSSRALAWAWTHGPSNVKNAVEHFSSSWFEKQWYFRLLWLGHCKSPTSNDLLIFFKASCIFSPWGKLACRKLLLVWILKVVTRIWVGKPPVCAPEEISSSPVYQPPSITSSDRYITSTFNVQGIESHRWVILTPKTNLWSFMEFSV